MLKPEITYWIDILRVLTSLSFLLASSWYDYKFREVSNRMWILFAPVGFTLTFLQYCLHLGYDAGKASSILLSWALSIAVTTGISLTLFYAGFFGGADAKALICLSIAIPTYPEFSIKQFYVMIPLFPLAVLVNAVLVSSMLVLAILCHNIIRYLQLKGDLFKGFEHEPRWKKVLVFITGIKVDLKKLSSSHYIPLEYVTIEENGGFTRHLKVSPQLEMEDPKMLEKIEPEREVWATPGLPFLIFMTAGFLMALFLGDFITWLMNLMLI